ncbi:DUF317 domain-containing protein [Kitasatospora sp. NPDC057015]|uniref:DUF317 domain-containing protein n=1 Tax=Kitasatospora sp. NPDC057015 TaxID=3346001 RepID=UPI00363092DF
MPTAPADHVLVRPLHLAGRGTSDFAQNLVTYFGWSTPPGAGEEILLVSPDRQAHLAWRAAPARWEVTAPEHHRPRSRWTAAFDDHAPSEIAAAFLYTLAHGLEHAPLQLLYPVPSQDAALGVLHHAGWAFQQRDGHEVLLAPDRLAALTRPLASDDAPTVLTGAAEHGTWSITFSSRTPAVLLQAAAATLLRPAVRPLDDLPTTHRERILVEAVPSRPVHRALVSPRHLAGSAEPAAPPLANVSALWHRTRRGRAESSCGRVRVEAGPDLGVLVTAGPSGPEHRLGWSAEFTRDVPPEITGAWLDSLTDSVAADIDLGTRATFTPGPGMSIGDAVEPLTAAGWVTHTDGADLHLVSPDGHATARITHGLLTPGTTTADACTRTAHWGASVDVTGAPGHRWRAAVSPHTPLHLVRALSAAVVDPAPVTRSVDRVPAQFLGTVRLEAADAPLSPAARASRSRSPATTVVTAPRAAEDHRPSGLLDPRPRRAR